MEGRKIGRVGKWAMILVGLASPLLATRSIADPAPLANPSFETPVLKAGTRSNGYPGWNERDGNGDPDSFVEHIASFSADGTQHLGLVQGYYVWQDTGIEWAPHTRYTLRVAVGRRGSHTSSRNRSIYGLLMMPPNPATQPGAIDVAKGSGAMGFRVANAAQLSNLTFADADEFEVTTGLIPPAGTVVVLLGDDSVSGRSHFDAIRLDVEPVTGAQSAVTNPGNFNLLLEPAPPAGGAAVVTNRNTWSVAYDPLGDALFWSDIDSGEIRRTDVDGGNAAVIYQQAGGILRGLQVDPYAGQLYWLDSALDQAVVADLDGSDPFPLIQGFVRPNDMAHDRENGFLFITDSGHDLVVRYELSSGTILFWTVPGPWGIALDHEADTVYVSTDAGIVLAFAPDGTPAAGAPVFESTGSILRGLEFDPYRCKLLAVDAAANVVHEIDPVTGGAAPSAFFATQLDNARDIVLQEIRDRDGNFIDDVWEFANFGSVGMPADSDDDGDLLNLFGEFAFGGDPNEADWTGTSMPSGNPRDGMLNFEQQVRSTSEHLDFSVRMSLDLRTWQALPDIALTSSDTPVPGKPGLVLRRYSLDLGRLPPLLPITRMFFRVGANAPAKSP